MGIIKQQAIKGTIITYAAVVVGFITTAIYLPKLDTEIVGLVNILVTYANVIAMLAGLGFGLVTIKFFAYFRSNENNHNGFMFVASLVTTLGFGIALFVIYLIFPVIERNRETGNLFVEYFFYLIPMVFFLMWYTTFDSFYRAIFKSIRGVLLKELVQKLSALLAVMLLVYNLVDIDLFVLIYCVGFCLPGIIMWLLILSEGHFILKPNFDFLDRSLRSQMISVGFFGIISGASGVIALNVDRMMIESLNGLSDTGIYSIAFYFGALISMPSRSLLKIASPIIAESWKQKDVANIKMVYMKSSITQFVIGMLLLIGLIINLENIIAILSDNYANGKWVIILIGGAFLSDMAVGAAGQVIGTSEKYKINTYLMIGYVALVIFTNYIFIPIYGITGAAFATLLSKLIYNLSRVIAMKKVFNMQPYSLKFIWVILVAIGLVFLNELIPTSKWLVADIIFRSSIISIVYIILMLVLRVSEDLNDYAQQLLNLFQSK